MSATILLFGCNGRMGREVSQLCAESLEFKVLAGVDVLTSQNFDYLVTAQAPENCAADVVLCFSPPAGAGDAIIFARKSNKPLIMATTGLNKEQESLLKEASREVAVFQSANFSVGIALLVDMVRRAAKILGEGFDIEIIERHHGMKVDAPSGTAIMLYQSAQSASPHDLEPVYDRHSYHRTRGNHEIGIHTVRGGTIVGQHEVLFAGQGETIEMRHVAQSRSIFAAGALRAVSFIKGRPSGLYTMQDLVSVSE